MSQRSTISTQASDLGFGERHQLQVIRVRSGARSASPIRFIRIAVAQVDLISRQQHWGEDRVIYAGDDARLRTVSTAFTDLAAPDAFRLVADGRAGFRTVDLMALCELLDRLGAHSGSKNE
jgi:hypothetical protein